jgi:hypothetical protein
MALGLASGALAQESGQKDEQQPDQQEPANTSQ